MDERLRRWSHAQGFHLPPSEDDFVPAGRAARLIRDVVSQELDLWRVLGSYDSHEGRSPYHPVTTTALLE